MKRCQFSYKTFGTSRNSMLVTFFLILQNLFLYLFWKIIRFFFFFFISLFVSVKNHWTHFLASIRMWMIDHILILVKINLIRPIYTWFTVYLVSFASVAVFDSDSAVFLSVDIAKWPNASIHWTALQCLWGLAFNN